MTTQTTCTATDLGARCTLHAGPQGTHYDSIADRSFAGKTYRYRLVAVRDGGFRVVCDYPSEQDASRSRERLIRHNIGMFNRHGEVFNIERYLVQQ